jgi:hypothetical protein
MTDAKAEATFESLIEEAKEYGSNWHVDHQQRVTCVLGDCVLGAVMRGRGLSIANLGLSPTASAASVKLDIPYELAWRVTKANDDAATTQSDREYLLKTLGITQA